MQQSCGSLMGPHDLPFKGAPKRIELRLPCFPRTGLCESLPTWIAAIGERLGVDCVPAENEKGVTNAVTPFLGSESETWTQDLMIMNHNSTIFACFWQFLICCIISCFSVVNIDILFHFVFANFSLFYSFVCKLCTGNMTIQRHIKAISWILCVN